MPASNIRTLASDPVSLSVARGKIARFHPDLYRQHRFLGLIPYRTKIQKFWQTQHALHLMAADSRAAVVVATQPLLIAAYSDELDCVALLYFPQWLVEEYGLKMGSRLLALNLYDNGKTAPCADLDPGPRASGRYRNFHPLIAEFLTDDLPPIARRKSAIDEAEWLRAAAQAKDYVTRHPGLARDGRPTRSADVGTVSADHDLLSVQGQMTFIRSRWSSLPAWTLLLLGLLAGFAWLWNHVRLETFAQVAVCGGLLLLAALYYLQNEEQIRLLPVAGDLIRKIESWRTTNRWYQRIALMLVILGACTAIAIGGLMGPWISDLIFRR